MNLQWMIVGLCVVALAASEARELEGVKLEPTVSLGGSTLQLNGAGVRVFRFLGVPIRIYVAAFYAPTPLRTEAAVMSASGPLQFDFTFLRDVNQGQVTEAWTKQIDQSASFRYPGFEQDRDAFVGMFGPLKARGTQTVQLVGDRTVVIDQGTRRGVIRGRNFQKAFLSMWFGPEAVEPGLKTNLLGGG